MLNSKVFTKSEELKATREGFGEGLLEAAKRNKQIYALTADVANSVGLIAFAKELPAQFVEVGVAEQNLVTVAAGLALAGKKPFCAAFAAFSPGRNWEQIKTTICYNNVPVTIVGSHVGLGVGEDGATHQMLEDIALMRVIPNMQVIVPCDAIQAKIATIALSKSNKPAYLRVNRQKSPIMIRPENDFEIGKIQIFKEFLITNRANKTMTKDICIISCGPILYDAMLAASSLSASKINTSVINCHTIKPLDSEGILNQVKDVKLVVVIEDHQISGGLGSAISELLSSKLPKRILFIGVNDLFGESGEEKELYKKYGLDAESIKSKINSEFKNINKMVKNANTNLNYRKIKSNKSKKEKRKVNFALKHTLKKPIKKSIQKSVINKKIAKKQR